MTVFYSTPHYTLTPLQIKGLKNSWILGENWWIHLINYRGVLQESEVNLTLGFEVLFEVYEPYFFNGCIFRLSGILANIIYLNPDTNYQRKEMAQILPDGTICFAGQKLPFHPKRN